MTIDVALVEVDRGESRLLDGSCGWSRRCRVRGAGKEICATKWALWYGIVIVVRCEREIDRRLRRLIDFAHATVVLAIGVAHEIMRCTLYL